MRSIPYGTPAHFGRWLYRAAALCISLTLAACGGGGGAPMDASPNAIKMAVVSTAAAPNVTVTGITKLSETRVSRTVYDYIFQVTVKNNGTEAQSSVSATLTGVGPGTTIVDGTVTVGNLAAGATVMPPDTITLRQDRTLSFNEGMLVWAISADISAPPPPPSTVAGLDIDADGVRDDVQAYILATYSSQPLIRNGLLQLAKGLQLAAIATTPADIDAATTARQDAAVCLADRTDAIKASALIREIKAQQFTSEARIQAEISFNRAIAGQLKSWTPNAPEATCK